jgi:MFS family permease
MMGAGAMVLVAMLASFTPTPLYPLYQQAWGMSDATVSVVFAAYPVGVLVYLVGLGGLADRIGRRLAMVAGGTLLLVAMVVLSLAPGPDVLVGGRLLHGLASGMVTTAAAAAFLEDHVEGAFVNSLIISGGIAVGPLLSGTLATVAPAPLRTPYLAVGALIPIAGAWVLTAPPDRPPTTDAGLLRPIRVARSIRAPFVLAASGIVATNLTMSLFGAYGPLIAATVGWRSPDSAGRLAFLLFAMITVASVVGRRTAPLLLLGIGGALVAVGWGVTALGTAPELGYLVITGAILLGGGSGLSLLGGTGLVGAIAPTGRVAETYAAFLVVAFLALGGGALVTGPALGLLSVTTLLPTVSVVVAVGTVTLIVVHSGASARQWTHADRTPEDPSTDPGEQVPCTRT